MKKKNREVIVIIDPVKVGTKETTLHRDGKMCSRQGLARALQAVILAGAALLISSSSPAQPVLFSDSFDTDTSANWTVTNGSGNGTPDFSVFFNFNYQTNKFVRNGVTNTIPAAPNGGGNGVKMYVNKNDAVADIAAVSLYPTSKVFSNDFALRFDMWLNYNGGSAGGSGSTEFGTFGINHVGDKVNWQDGVSPSDGVWFAVTGEAGAANDYRSYVGDNSQPAIRSLGLAGGFLDRNGDGIYEEEVFDEPVATAPLKQMFPPPQFETPGVPGKQWVQVEIRQRTNDAGGHTVTWLMNNYVIAETSNGDSVGMTMGTIMIGNMDIFSSIANPAADNYVIYDNVRVVDLSGVATNPVVTVTATDDTATESPPGDNGVFTITRTGSTANPLTVSYRMQGSASNTVDYVSLPGSVTLLPGADSTNITVTPINDSRGEGTETVIMVLLGSTNYDLYTNISAIVNLLDDGDLPAATITTIRKAAFEGNTNSAGQFRVDISNPFFSDVTVNYTTAGTAVNGVNYVLLPGSVVIPTGSTNAFIRVLAIDDSSTVSNTTATINLTTGTGYTLGTSTNGTVTIFNDDLSPATATLFSDNFEVDSSANWNINPFNANCDATFAYNYNDIGVPPAPHSTGGSTLGLRLRANSPALGAALFSGISVSPKNQNFTNDFRLRFDWWINSAGPFPAGATGSTQLGLAGITRGTIAQWPGGSITTFDSTYFAMSSDGGTAPDVRVYTTNGAVIATSTGVYAAGTGTSAGGEEDPYYSVFGGLPAPAAQLASYTSQTGLTGSGSPNEVWHDVVVTKLGKTLTWTIDGLRMATINAENFGITLSTNIFVGHSDINTSQIALALDPIECNLIDNLKVESLPLPTVNITGIALGGNNAVISFTGGLDDPAVAYKVQSAAVVTGPYNDSAATITNSAPGVFSATIAQNGDARYYRLRR